MLTQILQLWLYQDVMGNDLKRKTRMLKRNMMSIDETNMAPYKQKVKNCLSKIKSVVMILPKELRKFQSK